MDSISPEQEQQPPGEVVHLNQEFTLFDPKKVKEVEVQEPKQNPPQFYSDITLITENLSPLPWEINAGRNDMERMEVFAPFDPEEGARIIYGPQGVRIQQGEKEPERDMIDPALFPNTLLVAVGPEKLEKVGVVDFNLPQNVHNETLEKLKKLRLQVYFQNGLKFESKIDEEMLTRTKYDDCQLQFTHFYPLEIGSEKAALEIQLPSELNQLSTIRGKFLLAGEEGDRTEVPEVFNEAFDR